MIEALSLRTCVSVQHIMKKPACRQGSKSNSLAYRPVIISMYEQGYQYVTGWYEATGLSLFTWLYPLVIQK